MDWNTIWTTVSDFLVNNGLQILSAILVLILGYFVVKLCLRLIRSWLKKTKISTTVQSFLLSIAKVILYVILVMIILQVLGIPITALATVLATAGVAISLALKDSLSNVAYGMILITTRPFEQGHYIQVGNVEGTVKRIDIMSTQIVSPDNKLITIPNNIVYSNYMINYSAEGSRRIDIYFSIAYDSNMELVKKVAQQICHSNGSIALNPEPEIHIHSFDDSNITMFLKCWSTAPYWDAYYYIMDNLHNELARNGIKMNYPQVEMRVRTDDETIPFNKKPLPKRVEKVAEKSDSLNIFDIESFSDFQHKLKNKKLKRLKDKRAKLEKEMGALEATMPGTKIALLIKTRSIVLKKKTALKRASVPFVMHKPTKTTQKPAKKAKKA